MGGVQFLGDGSEIRGVTMDNGDGLLEGRCVVWDGSLFDESLEGRFVGEDGGGDFLADMCAAKRFDGPLGKDVAEGEEESLTGREFGAGGTEVAGQLGEFEEGLGVQLRSNRGHGLGSGETMDGERQLVEVVGADLCDRPEGPHPVGRTVL